MKCGHCRAIADEGIYHDCKQGRCSCYVGDPVLCEYHGAEKPVDYMKPTRSARAIQMERAEEHAKEAVERAKALEYSCCTMEISEAISAGSCAIVHALLAIAAATAARGEQ